MINDLNFPVAPFSKLGRWYRLHKTDLPAPGGLFKVTLKNLGTFVGTIENKFFKKKSSK